MLKQCCSATLSIKQSGIKDAIGYIIDTCHEDDKCLHVVIEK